MDAARSWWSRFASIVLIVIAMCWGLAGTQPVSAQTDPHIQFGEDTATVFLYLGHSYLLIGDTFTPNSLVQLNRYAGFSCTGTPTVVIDLATTDGSGEFVGVHATAPEINYSIDVLDVTNGNSNCINVVTGAASFTVPLLGVNGTTGPLTVDVGETLTAEALGLTPFAFAQSQLYLNSPNCIGVATGHLYGVNAGGSVTYTLNPVQLGVHSLLVQDQVSTFFSNCVQFTVTDTSSTSTAEAAATQTADAAATQTAEAGATQTADVLATFAAGTEIALTQTADVISTQTAEAGATQTVDAGATATSEAQISETLDALSTGTAEVEATETQESINATGTVDSEAAETMIAEMTATSDAAATQTASAPTATDVPPTATDVPPTATDEPPTATVELPGSVVVTITTSTGDPIPDDTVVCLDATCIDLDAEFSSDDAPNGSSVTFADVAPGSHSVTASTAGVAAFAGTVEVLAGEAAQVAIELQLDDDATPIAPTEPTAPAPTSAPVVVLPSTGTGSSSTMPMLLMLMTGSVLLIGGAMLIRRTRGI